MQLLDVFTTLVRTSKEAYSSCPAQGNTVKNSLLCKILFSCINSCQKVSLVRACPTQAKAVKRPALWMFVQVLKGMSIVKKGQTCVRIRPAGWTAVESPRPSKKGVKLYMTDCQFWKSVSRKKLSTRQSCKKSIQLSICRESSQKPAWKKLSDSTKSCQKPAL